MEKSLDVAELRKDLKMNREEFARLAGVDPATVWRWEKEVPERGPARALLERIREETPSQPEASLQ